MCQSFYQYYSPVPLVTKIMTLRLNINYNSGMIKSSHGQQALPLKPSAKIQNNSFDQSVAVIFLRTDTSDTLK